MQARTQWTHSDVLSQLATTREWSFKIGDRQNAKRQWNTDRRAIYNVTHCIDAGRWVFRHRGVSDGSDGARPLWWSHSARTEYFFADVELATLPNPWFSSGSGLAPHFNRCNRFHPIKNPNLTEPAVFRPVPQFHPPTSLAPIKYLSFDCITKWSICKRCSFACSFTAYSSLCNPISIRCVTAKTANFWRFPTASQQILIGSQSGK